MIGRNLKGKGVYYLFGSDSFHYQALRTLGHAPYQGAAPGEVMSVISGIRDQDEDSWIRGWRAMAERCEAWAKDAADGNAKGNALLRASNYHRTSEFFIYPGDARKQETYDRHEKAFDEALVALGIPHKMLNVPYGKGLMKTYYFRGEAGKPLVIVCGGFDSTNTESYFWIGKPLIDRGYSVAMFEGPGQSGMIRRYGIPFTPEWHEPVGLIIDALCAADPSVMGKKKILFGISLGGILMGRAAAFEKRADGVALFGAPFDFLEGILHQLPSIARKLFFGKRRGTFNFLAAMKKRTSITGRWGLMNGLCSIGGRTPYEYLEKAARYTLKDTHEKTACPVLVFYGERDWFISDGIQDEMFRKAFRNAKTYVLKTFPFEDGSSEHCQVGAIEQSAMVFDRWAREQGFRE